VSLLFPDIYGPSFFFRPPGGNQSPLVLLVKLSPTDCSPPALSMCVPPKSTIRLFFLSIPRTWQCLVSRPPLSPGPPSPCRYCFRFCVSCRPVVPLPSPPTAQQRVRTTTCALVRARFPWPPILVGAPLLCLRFNRPSLFQRI